MKKKNVQLQKLQLDKTVIYTMTNDQLLAVHGGVADKKKEPKDPKDPTKVPTFTSVDNNCGTLGGGFAVPNTMIDVTFDI